MSRRGWWLFAAMSVIWGVPYLLIKVVDDGGVAPPVLVLARVGIGAALLLPIAVRRGELAPLLPYWHWLVAFALAEIVVPWLLLSEAETRLSSSLSGLLIACVPIIVAIFSRLTGGERLSPIRWTGLLVGLGGVALLLVDGTGRGDGLSVAEVLGVAVCYAIGPMIASRKLADVPPLGMTAACLGFAAVLYSPLAAVDWPSAVPAAKVLGSLAGLAVVCTAAAFLLFFALIAEAGPARATVITYLNPAVAVTLGVTVLGEHFTLAMAGAFVLILGGCLLATRKGTASPPAAAEPADAVPAGYRGAPSGTAD